MEDRDRADLDAGRHAGGRGLGRLTAQALADAGAAVLKPGAKATPDELVQHTRSLMASYKAPAASSSSRRSRSPAPGRSSSASSGAATRATPAGWLAAPMSYSPSFGERRRCITRTV